MSSNLSFRRTALRLKTLSAAVLSTLCFAQAHAIGLGDLSVQSSLGQPLRAEIELVGPAKDDEGGLRVKLASFEAYRQANIEFNPALLSLRFAIERRDNRQLIRVASPQAMNEPFIDLLLEVTGSSGRMVREYVFLLDPTSLQAVQTTAAPADSKAAPKSGANVVAQAAAKTSLSQATQPAPRRAAPAPVKASVPHESAVRPAANASAGGKPRLHLSSVNAVSSPDAAAAMVDREEYASMEKALADANARVKALEVKVGELQKLLEVTNSLLAELQKQNALTKSAGTASAPLAARAAAPSASAEAKPAEVKNDAPAVPARPKPAAPPPSPPEPGWFDNALLLPGAGLLLVALGAAGLYLRRRREQKPFDATTFAATNTVENTSTQGLDTGTLNSGYTLLGTPSHGGDGEVDAMSEADVYIAYGRDVQAEEVLKDALLKQPERHALRVKLLSIYAGRKDRHAYEALARELYRMTKGEGEDWMHAVAMGIEMDPGNPLYAQGKPRAQPEIIMASAEAHDLDDALPVPEDSPEEKAQSALSDKVDAMQTTSLPPVMSAEERPSSVQLTSNDLDFDLDGMQPDKAEEEAQAAAGPIDFALPELPAAEKPEEPVAETGPIDFDFVLPSIPIPEEPAKPHSAEPDIAPLDFDFVVPGIAAGIAAGSDQPEREDLRVTK
ncbi:hypothetical protein [Noviherbaspirillum sp.]|uniref:type IV pilus assembly protein FimV n=1 Tax=Noviherbaspirillum sp. TaxID=1926288 RepID=UPI002B49B9E7|nr:hypothetical protein [Noviherbaspirillum sp.]HJV81203.1 hypothetical protein [Noviherbaspirillum sp.]